MRKFKFALVGLVAVPALVACAGAEETVQNDTKEVTTTYRGEEIHCLSVVYDRGIGLSCDYERFYNENPLLAR